MDRVDEAIGRAMSLFDLGIHEESSLYWLITQLTDKPRDLRLLERLETETDRLVNRGSQSDAVSQQGLKAEVTPPVSRLLEKLTGISPDLRLISDCVFTPEMKLDWAFRHLGPKSEEMLEVIRDAACLATRENTIEYLLSNNSDILVPALRDLNVLGLQTRAYRMSPECISILRVIKAVTRAHLRVSIIAWGMDGRAVSETDRLFFDINADGRSASLRIKLSDRTPILSLINCPIELKPGPNIGSVLVVFDSARMEQALEHYSDRVSAEEVTVVYNYKWRLSSPLSLARGPYGLRVGPMIEVQIGRNSYTNIGTGLFAAV